MTGIPDIATLADKQAITEVIRTYCRAVDRLDIPLGQSIFHEDGYADYNKGFYQGPGKGVIEAICQSHHDLTSHSHQVTNILIEVDGDKAGSESYIYGTMRSEHDGKAMHIGVWGRYLDKWEKREGRWGIVRRMVVFEHDEMREVTPANQEARSTRDASDPSYEFLTARKWGDAIDV
jgi:hypothetical protein